jgi:hypothetical protein
MKLQSHAEHQQDDAYFGELLGNRAISHEPRRSRSHRNAGQEVSDDR